jgi:general secretion pathway protein C
MQDIHSSRWLDRLLERSPDYASFALVITCGFLLARLVWALFPANPSVPDSAGVGNESPPPTIVQDMGEKIANYHVFGQYTPNKPAVPVDSKNLPNTQLALSLGAVYVNGNRGQAVINEGGKEHVCAIGGKIGNSNATLAEVHADHAVILENGERKRLDLPKLAALGKSSNAPPAQNLPDEPQPPIMDDPAMMGGMEPPSMSAPDMPTPDMLPPDMNIPAESLPQPDAGNNLSDFRDATLNNNAKLLEAVSPQPYEANGKFVGFRLMPGSNPGLFNKAGLQPGDIVTAINGTVLDSSAAGMQALQGASSASQINLSITRGGQQINLPLSF